MLNIEQDLITLVAEAANPKQVDESIADIAATATATVGALGATALTTHAIYGFLNKFTTPKEHDLVKHNKTGQGGQVKFVHANGKLNINWDNGSNTSHDKSEVSLDY